MMKRIFLLTAFLLSVTALLPRPALADSNGGQWGVVLIAESGSCDRGFRYPVLVTNTGAASYQGDSDITFTGTVSPDGAMKFTAGKGTMKASGTGKLADGKGAGPARMPPARAADAGKPSAENGHAGPPNENAAPATGKERR